MKMISSILVATDLTDGSDAVVRAAGELAVRLHAELHVLHAFDFPAQPPGRETIAPSFQGRIEAAERELEAQLARAVPAGVEVASRRVEIYVAHRAILDAASGAGAGLIVLGPHSRRRRGEEILGSTADRVIRTSPVPCLIVRAPLPLPLRKIVVPIDLSAPAIGALEVGLSWGVRLGCHDDAVSGTELIVLHVLPRAFQGPEFPFDRAVIGPDLHREVEAARHRIGGALELEVSEEIRWGETAVDEIVRMASDEGTGLLVLGTHGLGVVKRALIGSVASGVARRAPCPVLLVPPAMMQSAEVGDTV